MWLPGFKPSEEHNFVLGQKLFCKKAFLFFRGELTRKVSRLLRWFPPPLLFFWVVNKPNSRWFKPWPFYPLVGGHQHSPLKGSRELTIPKRSQTRRIARLTVSPLFLFDFVSVFWGSETSFDSMFFFEAPKENNVPRSGMISGANVWHQPKQCKITRERPQN